MCGINKPDQWQIAQALYVVGSLGKLISMGGRYTGYLLEISDGEPTH